MLRYVCTRWAHERNPNEPGSPAWEAFNRGFIETVMPPLPSRWAVAYWAIMMGGAGLIMLAWVLFLFWLVR